MTKGNGDTVEIFTDGACSGNPGPGGWAAILRWRGTEKELSGFAADTTNNRMEMMAALRGVEALKLGVRARLYTDSLYLRDGITRWIERWKRNGWRTAPRNRSRTRTCGAASMRPSRATRWNGTGSRATPGTP